MKEKENKVVELTYEKMDLVTGGATPVTTTGGTCGKTVYLMNNKCMSLAKGVAEGKIGPCLSCPYR